MDRLRKNFFADINTKYITIFILSLIPIIFVAKTVIGFSVDLPYRDDWWLYTRLIDKVYTSQATFLDFWKPDGMHRFLIARIVAVSLIHFGKWQCVHFTMLNLLLTAAAFSIMGFWIINNYGKRTINELVLWTIPIISLSMFSLNYGSYWVFNTALVDFLSLSTTVIGIFVLSGAVKGIRGYIIALLFGLFTSLNAATGNFFWVIGLLVLLYQRFNGEYKDNSRIILWCMIAGGIAVSLITDYRAPEGYPSAFYAFEDISGFWRFFFTMLGNPVSLYEFGFNTIRNIGILGIIWFVCSVIYFFKQDKGEKTFLLPFIALGLFSVITALFITTGRGGHEFYFAVADRYILKSTLYLWLCNIVISMVYLSKMELKSHIVFKLAVSAVVFITISMLLLKNIPQYQMIEWHATRLSQAKQLILAEKEDSTEYKSLFLNHDEIPKEYLHILKKYKLSLYRETKE